MRDLFSWIKARKKEESQDWINPVPADLRDCRESVIVQIPAEVLATQLQSRIDAVREAALNRQRELYWEEYYKIEKVSVDPVFVVYDRYKDLIHEHKIVFQDWADADLSYLIPNGYERYKVQSISRSGLTSCYCRRGLVEKNKEVDASFHKKRGQPFKYRMKQDEHAREIGSKVANQSLDHYTSVIQLHALLLHYNFEDIQVSHRSGPDLIAVYQDKSFCFEYEHQKTRSVEALQIRYESQCKEFDYVKYITPSEAYFKVVSAIGQPDTIRRGYMLLDFLNSV